MKIEIGIQLFDLPNGSFFAINPRLYVAGSIKGRLRNVTNLKTGEWETATNQKVFQLQLRVSSTLEDLKNGEKFQVHGNEYIVGPLCDSKRQATDLGTGKHRTFSNATTIAPVVTQRLIDVVTPGELILVEDDWAIVGPKLNVTYLKDGYQAQLSKNLLVNHVSARGKLS